MNTSKEQNVKLILSLYKGKNKVRILKQLTHQPLRFNELKKSLEPISKKMLSNQLKELENDGLVCKSIYPEVPVRVVYSLTELSKAAEPLFKEINAWQNLYRQTYAHLIKDDHFLVDDYSSDLIFHILGDKWKSEILYVLKDEKKRFGQIKKELSPISQKVLTQQLRDLEHYCLIVRTIYNEKSPKVEYQLTPLCSSLKQIGIEMNKFGKIYYQYHERKNPLHK